jgi:hypothetical protein
VLRFLMIAAIGFSGALAEASTITPIIGTENSSGTLAIECFRRTAGQHVQFRAWLVAASLGQLERQWS